MKSSIVLFLIASVFLLGCASPVETETKLEDSQEPQEETLGQMLPIEARAIMGDTLIELEITKTPEQQALGLMYRESLPDNRGMLFSFDPPKFTQFWMKNVKIPLDMIFLREGEIQAIAANVPPCNTFPCPTYGPEGLIDQVIELRGGRAAEIGLEVGDRITIEFFD
ncbi:MAG: DUF192 domain-containing protein [Chroococcales cyanobacterium]